MEILTQWAFQHSNDVLEHISRTLESNSTIDCDLITPSTLVLTIDMSRYYIFLKNPLSIVQMGLLTTKKINVDYRIITDLNLMYLILTIDKVVNFLEIELCLLID